MSKPLRQPRTFTVGGDGWPELFDSYDEMAGAQGR